MNQSRTKNFFLFSIGLLFSFLFSTLYIIFLYHSSFREMEILLPIGITVVVSIVVYILIDFFILFLYLTKRAQHSIWNFILLLCSQFLSLPFFYALFDAAPPYAVWLFLSGLYFLLIGGNTMLCFRTKGNK